MNRSLDRDVLTEEIIKIFENYGKVIEVFFPERSNKSYAFVTFESSEATRQALEYFQSSSSTTTLFQQIRPAQLIRNQHKEKKQEKRAIVEWKQKFDLAVKSNVICQLHESHVERLIDFLKDSSAATDGDSESTQSLLSEFHVVGSIPTTSKTVSLVFVHATFPAKFIDWFGLIWFLQPIVHRVFSVDRYVRGTLELNVVKDIHTMIGIDTEDKSTTVRLQVFPPKLQTILLEAIEEHPDSSSIILSPTNSSCALCVIQLDDGPGPDSEGGLFGIGLSKVNTLGTTISNESKKRLKKNKHSNICRAFWKLQEIFQRYKHQLPDDTIMKKPFMALDCGAAPGGWTQFLSKTLGENCHTIFSIDPGQLAPSVLALSQVQHWPLTIQKALPMLCDQNITIQVWVSDMCVKDMEQQVDWLLEARHMGVVTRGTFFVLTLKCIVGHSSNTFDLLVDRQWERLHGISKNVQKIHLFSNRISERTLVGYLT